MLGNEVVSTVEPVVAVEVEEGAGEPGVVVRSGHSVGGGVVRGGEEAGQFKEMTGAHWQ